MVRSTTDGHNTANSERRARPPSPGRGRPYLQLSLIQLIEQALGLYFLCSTQFRMNFIQLINVKMLTIVFWHFNIYGLDNVHAHGTSFVSDYFDSLHDVRGV